jgi:hypothetical protein
MTAGVDIGIDPHRDARDRTLRRRNPSMRTISPGDSTLMAPTPSPIARSSSARVLPTPVTTMSDGAKPARSATSSSPPEVDVRDRRPAPAAAATMPSVALALSA